MHRASGFLDIVSNDTAGTATSNAPSLAAPKNSRPRPLRRPSKKKFVGISIEEVEAANTAKKPWVAIRGKVYDLTNFVEKHPGGSDFVLASVGRDATAMYESIHDEKNSRVLKWVIMTVCRMKLMGG
jgi:cytochrome b involved in lipid metabolism